MNSPTPGPSLCPACHPRSDVGDELTDAQCRILLKATITEKSSLTLADLHQGMV